MPNNRIAILVALEGADEEMKRALTSAERSLGEFFHAAKSAGEKAAAGVAQVETSVSAFNDQVAKDSTQLLTFLAIKPAGRHL